MGRVALGVGGVSSLPSTEMGQRPSHLRKDFRPGQGTRTLASAEYSMDATHKLSPTVLSPTQPLEAIGERTAPHELLTHARYA